MKLKNPHLDHFPSLVAMFFDRAERGGDDPFLWRKADRAWQPLSWRQVAHQVAALAHHLRALGLKNGDRVVLVSENRPEWCIADLGIMAAGCITVPTYTTNTERDHQHILDNSGASAVFVSDAKLAKTLMPAVMRSNARLAIEPNDKLMPAIKQQRDFIANEYLPATRDTVGLDSLPDGKAWYAFNAKQSTTTAQTPEQIHAIGLKEVERIHGEMRVVMEQVGFKGSLQDFFTFMQKDKQFEFKSEPELLEHYRGLEAKINANVPKLKPPFKH